MTAQRSPRQPREPGPSTTSAEETHVGDWQLEGEVAARCGLSAFLRSLCWDHVTDEKSRLTTGGRGQLESQPSPSCLNQASGSASCMSSK